MRKNPTKMLENQEGVSRTSRASHLPAWLIASRDNLRRFGEDQEKLDNDLSNLQHEIKSFNNILTTMRKDDDGSPPTLVHRATAASGDIIIRPLASVSVLDLPLEVLSHLLTFMLVTEAVRYSLAGKAVRGLFSNDDIWQDIACQNRHPLAIENIRRRNRNGTTIAVNWREIAVDYHRKWSSAKLLLLRLTKERSTRRRASFEPRVYDRRHDRQVSHPIPVGRDNMMSFASTMNTDMIRRTIESLKDLAALTADSSDCLTLHRLRNADVLDSHNSAINVLVALLKNESAAIKELACICIANLLCTTYKGKAHVAVTPAAFSSEPCCATVDARKMAASASRESERVRQRLIAINGHKELKALLCSPTACVALAGRRGSTGTYFEPVQSMCSRHASRALINLYLPMLEVGLCEDEPPKKEEKKKMRATTKPTPPPVQVAAVKPVDSAVDWRVFDNRTWSGLLPPEESPPAAKVKEEGASANGGEMAFEKKPALPEWLQAAQALSRLQDATPIQSKAPVGNDVLPCLPHIHWEAFYFYTSGSRKDAFGIDLYFDEVTGAMSGDGRDNIGPFIMTATKDAPIWAGHSWNIKLTYTDRARAVPAGNGATRNELPREGHVRHTAFWSDRTTTGVGLGLFGVWEMVTSRSHFDLQRGGVFRMCPVRHLDTALQLREEAAGLALALTVAPRPVAVVDNAAVMNGIGGEEETKQEPATAANDDDDDDDDGFAGALMSLVDMGFDPAAAEATLVAVGPAIDLGECISILTQA